MPLIIWITRGAYPSCTAEDLQVQWVTNQSAVDEGEGVTRSHTVQKGTGWEGVGVVDDGRDAGMEGWRTEESILVPFYQSNKHLFI